MDFQKLSSFFDPKTFQSQFIGILFTLWCFTAWFSSTGCLITLLGNSILLLAAAWKITKWIRKCYFNEKLDSTNKAVLVTGCDTGFGNLLVRKLNSLGYLVYAGCLEPDGVEAQKLSKTVDHPKSLRILRLDVTKDEDVGKALQEVSSTLEEKEGAKLWAIVNNAGIAKLSLVEWGTLDDYSRVLGVNLMGMVRVTRAFLPLLRKSKGRVVNMSSLAGRIATPAMAAYAMSKHGVVAFSDALRREMFGWGVKVSTIEPAGYKTPMTDPQRAQKDGRQLWADTKDEVREDYGEKSFESFLKFFNVNDHSRNPEEVVEVMLDAICASQPEVTYRVCGIKYSLIWFLADYLPTSVFDRIIQILKK